MKLQALRQSLAGMPSSVMFVVGLYFANALPTRSSMFASKMTWRCGDVVRFPGMKVQQLENEEKQDEISTEKEKDFKAPWSHEGTTDGHLRCVTH